MAPNPDRPKSQRRPLKPLVGVALFAGLAFGEIIGWATSALGLPALGAIVAVLSFAFMFYFTGLDTGLTHRED